MTAITALSFRILNNNYVVSNSYVLLKIDLIFVVVTLFSFNKMSFYFFRDSSTTNVSATRIRRSVQWFKSNSWSWSITFSTALNWIVFGSEIENKVVIKIVSSPSVKIMKQVLRDAR